MFDKSGNRVEIRACNLNRYAFTRVRDSSVIEINNYVDEYNEIRVGNFAGSSLMVTVINSVYDIIGLWTTTSSDNNSKGEVQKSLFAEVKQDEILPQDIGRTWHC